MDEIALVEPLVETIGRYHQIVEVAEFIINPVARQGTIVETQQQASTPGWEVVHQGTTVDADEKKSSTKEVAINVSELI